MKPRGEFRDRNSRVTELSERAPHDFSAEPLLVEVGAVRWLEM